MAEKCVKCGHNPATDHLRMKARIAELEAEVADAKKLIAFKESEVKGWVSGYNDADDQLAKFEARISELEATCARTNNTMHMFRIKADTLQAIVDKLKELADYVDHTRDWPDVFDLIKAIKG